MQVYCTPRKFSELPHLNEYTPIPNEHSLLNAACQVCGMPLILKGRYISTGEIGNGGFGRTFLALDDNFRDKKRVLKQFSADRLIHPGYIKLAKDAFTDEAEILSELKHDRIPTVYGYFSLRVGPDPRFTAKDSGEQTFFYMVQEYVEGQDLSLILNQKNFIENEVRFLLEQMLDILKYIHSKNVIHQDIKPSNIVYSEQKKSYYLIDFGAAKVITDGPTSDTTRVRKPFFSPGFSPPEQLHGETDYSSDLYSLAMTCACLLTGKRITSDSSSKEDLRSLGLPENREQLANYASPALAKILSRMLEPNQRDRYPNAAAVLQALNTPETVINPLPPKPPKPPTKKLVVWGGIGAGAVASVALGYIFIHRPAPFQITEIKIPAQPQIMASVRNVPSGRFRYGGSTTWSELIKSVGPIILNAHPNFGLDYKDSGDEIQSSEAGIKMLVNNKLDFALSSIGIPDDLLKEGKDIQLAEVSVALSAFSVAVHPSLNIPGLTMSQYGDIISGKVKNWQEIGGPNLKIQIYMTDGKHLKGASFKEVKNATAAFKEIMQDPGGLHIASPALIVPQCGVKALPMGTQSSNLISPYQKPLVLTKDCTRNNHNKVDTRIFEEGKYQHPLIRNLSVVIVKDGGRKQKAGEAYAKILLTSQGQNLINEAGYKPIAAN
jgi:phosphate transport system substrate-binding protein